MAFPDPYHHKDRVRAAAALAACCARQARLAPPPLHRYVLLPPPRPPAAAPPQVVLAASEMLGALSPLRLASITKRWLEELNRLIRADANSPARTQVRPCRRAAAAVVALRAGGRARAAAMPRALAALTVPPCTAPPRRHPPAVRAVPQHAFRAPVGRHRRAAGGEPGAAVRCASADARRARQEVSGAAGGGLARLGPSAAGVGPGRGSAPQPCAPPARRPSD